MLKIGNNRIQLPNSHSPDFQYISRVNQPKSKLAVTFNAIIDLIAIRLQLLLK